MVVYLDISVNREHAAICTDVSTSDSAISIILDLNLFVKIWSCETCSLSLYKCSPSTLTALALTSATCGKLAAKREIE